MFSYHGTSRQMGMALCGLPCGGWCGRWRGAAARQACGARPSAGTGMSVMVLAVRRLDFAGARDGRARFAV